MALGFEPVSGRITVQDGVYQQLRHALMVGSFDPGQVLTIASLAEAFGTSNMPVREALRRLAAENALEISQNGSACVPVVTRARLDDLCRARLAVEGLAAELGAPRLTAADVASLQRVTDDQQAIGAPPSATHMARMTSERAGETRAVRMASRPKRHERQTARGRENRERQSAPTGRSRASELVRQEPVLEYRRRDECDDQSAQGCRQSEHERFGREQEDDVPGGGAECQTNREVAPAGVGLRDEQCRCIGGRGD